MLLTKAYILSLTLVACVVVDSRFESRLVVDLLNNEFVPLLQRIIFLCFFSLLVSQAYHCPFEKSLLVSISIEKKIMSEGKDTVDY